MSFRCTTPSTRRSSATSNGVPPEFAIRSTIALTSPGTLPPLAATYAAIASGAPLRMERPSISTPPMPLLGQHHDRAAFGCFVREGRELSGVRQILFLHSRRGEKLRGAAVTQGNRACLVQEQRIHIPGGFYSASRHCQHIPLDNAVHPRNSDGREQSSNRCGDQANQQRNENEKGLWRP